MARGLLALLAIALALLVATPAHTCSRVLWATAGQGVLVGRNMDWFEDIKSNMWLLPRGMERSGMGSGPAADADANPLRWTSRYGSVVITAYDAGTADAVNEAGLAGHMLYLPETGVGERDASIPGLSMSVWVQYYVDNFATVAEAIAHTRAHPYQLRMAVEPTSGRPATVHIALNDATGDSAILECIDGELTIYHDRAYTVMTNQPTFDKQLENLGQYRGFGGDRRLPGTHEPSDRFIRGAYYSKNLPEPSSEREAVAALMSVMRNVSAPFGVADPERPNVSTTVWRTITDLGRRVLYFDSVFSPQVFWVDLKTLDFAEGSGVRKLTLVGRYDHMGDSSASFEPAAMFAFLAPEP